MNSMRYKSFVWVNNPSSCQYDIERTFVNHKYPDIEGTELEDMGANSAIISGSGEFFGENAYAMWNALNVVFREGGVGDFYHPVYSDFTRGLMTKLRSSLEPREDYIAYTFEIVQDDPPETVVSMGSIPQSSGGSSFKVGDSVICNGYAYKTKDGGLPRTLLTNKTMIITEISIGSPYPIHIGSTGWISMSDIKLSGSSASTPSGETIYVVQAGDTLSKIGAKFGIDWHLIATLNNIKNPKVSDIVYPKNGMSTDYVPQPASSYTIYIGQKLKIPAK